MQGGGTGGLRETSSSKRGGGGGGGLRETSSSKTQAKTQVTILHYMYIEIDFLIVINLISNITKY